MPGLRYSPKKHMGKVLIVQNKDYAGLTREVKAEDENLVKMKETLNKMGFTDACIEVHENQTKSQMIQLLQNMAARKDLEDDYCFICMVLSYGQDGVITCYDETQSPKNPTAGMQLPVSELQECLKGNKCRGLLLKPKIFMLQLEEAPGDKKDGTKAETEAPQPKKIPKEADFLIYTCAKEIALATWIKGFEQYVLKPGQPGQPEHPLEIQKLLTRMNRLYCKHYSDEKMTVDTPCVTSLLTREAYLKIEEPSPK
uniref:Caspase family p20 domain-containing protein n=1 Tax=Magallana gigas TaxID=29159 RepID=A0A8W8KX15_MAGGI|nr:caspase-7 isoform X1 [Crassostrea gigas]